MLMLMHIAGGSVALASGAAAVAFRKGGARHAWIGTVFFGAMILMCASAIVVGAMKPERGTATVGAFTLYLISTSWTTARNRDGSAGRFEIGSLTAALAFAASFAGMGVVAAMSPNGRLDSLPAVAHYPFAGVALLAAALDLNFILRRRLSPRQRLARHLWRMCAALLIAAFSFFIGQQKVMPEYVRGSPWLFVPPVGTMVIMTYWIFRMRFGRALLPRRRRGSAPTNPKSIEQSIVLPAE